MAVTVSPYLKPYQLLYAITAIPDYATEFEAAHADYLAEVEAERPYICPKCSGTGQHAESVDTGEVGDTDLIECTMVTESGVACEGYGYTVTETRVVPCNTVTYEDAETEP